MYVYGTLHGRIQNKRKRNNSVSNRCVHWCCLSKIYFNHHKLKCRIGIGIGSIALLVILCVCVCVCVCRQRTIMNYENKMSGHSSRNISLLAGVRSLRKYRNDGGPFRTNLISTFCGRGDHSVVNNRRGCPDTNTLRSYIAFLMETFRRTLLLHLQKRNFLE